MTEIKNVTVVGAGTMGSQIALQTALAGRYQVTLVDPVPGQLDRARAQNRKLVDRSVEKGRLTREQADDALGRITESDDLDAAAKGADLVIEAVIEEYDTKKSVFTALGKAVFLAISENPPAVLLAASADSGIHAGERVQAAVAAAGGRGGGNQALAQGSVPAAADLDGVLTQLKLVDSRD